MQSHLFFWGAFGEVLVENEKKSHQTPHWNLTEYHFQWFQCETIWWDFSFSTNKCSKIATSTLYGELWMCCCPLTGLQSTAAPKVFIRDFTIVNCYHARFWGIWWGRSQQMPHRGLHRLESIRRFPVWHLVRFSAKNASNLLPRWRDLQ